MPEALSIASVIEKNRIDSEVPFLVLLDIQIVDPLTGQVGDTGYYVLNDEPVDFNGNNYSPSIFDISFKKEAATQAAVTLTINDFTQALQQQMEAFDGGVGSNITLSIVEASRLGDAPELQEFYQVTGSKSADYVTTFNLGAESCFGMNFPRRRQTRDFCQHRYKDADTCGYGASSYPFIEVTAGGIATYLRQSVPQSLIATNQTIVLSCYATPIDNKTFGLQVVNAGGTVIGDARFNKTGNGGLTVTNVHGTGGWSQTPIPGNYLVWVNCPGLVSASALEVRLCPRLDTSTASGEGAWMGAARLQTGVLQPNGYVETGDVANTSNALRYSGVPSNTVWVGVNAHVNAGFGTQTGPNTGLLADCDLTLDGSNGCLAHNNTLRFGGSPGMNTNGFRYA